MSFTKPFTDDTITINRGGTNSSTALSGSSIMVSNGSAIVQGSAGTATTVLHGNAAGAPSYSAVSLANDITGTLPIGNGGTGQTSYTDGQLLIGNSTGNTLTKATLTAGSGISITNGSGAITIASSGGSSVKYWRAYDYKTYNTHAGATTADTWHTRTLNTLENPFSDSSVTLSSNVLTITPGTYYFSGYGCFYGVNQNRVVLYNNDTSSNAIVGVSFYIGSTTSGGVLPLSGTLVISTTTNFTLRQYAGNAVSSYGLGRASAVPYTDEIYSQLNIIKLA